jgi:hypothetical protein
MTGSRCLESCKRREQPNLLAGSACDGRQRARGSHRAHFTPPARLSHVRRASAAHEPGEPLSHWPVASLPRLEYPREATVPAVTAGFAIRAAFATLSPIGYKSTDSGRINPVRDRCSSTAALPATTAASALTARCADSCHIAPLDVVGPPVRPQAGASYDDDRHAQQENQPGWYRQRAGDTLGPPYPRTSVRW